MADSKLDLLQGTLDLMVLQTLAAMGPMHGYGLARHSTRAATNPTVSETASFFRSAIQFMAFSAIS